VVLAASAGMAQRRNDAIASRDANTCYLVPSSVNRNTPTKIARSEPGTTAIKSIAKIQSASRCITTLRDNRNADNRAQLVPPHTTATAQLNIQAAAAAATSTGATRCRDTTKLTGHSARAMPRQPAEQPHRQQAAVVWTRAPMCLRKPRR